MTHHEGWNIIIWLWSWMFTAALSLPGRHGACGRTSWREGQQRRDSQSSPAWVTNVYHAWFVLAVLIWLCRLKDVSVVWYQGDRGSKGVQGEKGSKGQEGPPGEQVICLFSIFERTSWHRSWKLGLGDIYDRVSITIMIKGYIVYGVILLLLNCEN